MPFSDGTTAPQIMAKVQLLSERFVEYLRDAPELRGTGANQ